MTRLTHSGPWQPPDVDLFNHLVGAAEQREGHRQAQRLGSFEIDEQLDFGLHRPIRRGPAENRCRLSPRKIDAYSGMREA
jgi:hypothetical protein